MRKMKDLSFCHVVDEDDHEQISALKDDPLKLLKDLPNLLPLAIVCDAYDGEMLHFQVGFKKLNKLFLVQLNNLNSILINVRQGVPHFGGRTLIKGPKTLCNACGLRLARMAKAAAKEDCGKNKAPANSTGSSSASTKK
ncbi:hypothetical protein P8452_06150 [Trifolium repens]|nr:hypothetical protein P8452_06150 [Trifolium repens]